MMSVVTSAARRLCLLILSLAVVGCSSTTEPSTVTITSVAVIAPSTAGSVPVVPVVSSDPSAPSPESASDSSASSPGVVSSAPNSSAASSGATPPSTAPTAGLAWPATGAAAFQVGDGPVRSHGDDRPRAIASVAKVMTAYVILLMMPLDTGQTGPAYTITVADVADADRRYQLDESGVPVKKGEVINEREMLQALMLPSANNIAAVLAKWQRGTEALFVAEMNAKAAELGMTHTHYTDPSGYSDTTTSTATDQLLLVNAAMKIAAFADLVKLKTARIPVAGEVYNTNPLLGKDGFVGIKTGSDDAAGGCLAFRTVQTSSGQQLTITGVVLGQPGPNLIAAGANAARVLADSVTD